MWDRINAIQNRNLSTEHSIMEIERVIKSIKHDVDERDPVTSMRRVWAKQNWHIKETEHGWVFFYGEYGKASKNFLKRQYPTEMDAWEAFTKGEMKKKNE